MQHIRDGLEVLHLKDLGVDTATQTKLRSFLREAGSKQVLRGNDKTKGKAGASSRTPHGVFYTVKCIRKYRKVKEDFGDGCVCFRSACSLGLGYLNHAEEVAIGIFQDDEVIGRFITPRIASRSDLD